MTPDLSLGAAAEQNALSGVAHRNRFDVKRVLPERTALVGVQGVDSEQFGSQQVSRNYHLRGRILQVPSN